MDWSFTAHGNGVAADSGLRAEAIEKAARILRDADIGLSYAGSVDQAGSRGLFQASTGLDKLGKGEEDEAADDS